ncbi:MAG: tetratricopeptide repeat protein [Chitinophagales bacterium]
MKNCSRCGAPMPDNAGFCGNCGGTMLQSETVRVTTGNQNAGLGMKFKLIAGAVLSILLVAGGYLGWNSLNSEARFEKKLELAVKYLNENKYDEAILAYNDAIKIDPKNMEARVGLAQAYIGKGDFVQADKAVDTAKQVGAISPEQYQLLIEAYIDKDKFKEADQLLVEAQGEYKDNGILADTAKLLTQEKAKLEDQNAAVPVEPPPAEVVETPDKTATAPAVKPNTKTTPESVDNTTDSGSVSNIY